MSLAPWLQPLADRLLRRAAQGSLPHAILLLGVPAAGRALAQYIARSMLCEGESKPCGTCGSCRLLLAATHPDFFLSQADSKSGQITVDQIRHLIDRSTLTASRGGWRIFLVDAADCMNRNAANALLKTLEEPPAGTLLLLTASRRSRMPATVISRCQVYALPLAAGQAADWLAAQRPDLEKGQIVRLLEIVVDPFETLELLAGQEPETLGQVDEPLVPVMVRIASGEEDVARQAARWSGSLAPLRLARLARLWRDVTICRLLPGTAVDAATRQLAGLTAGMDLASLFHCYRQTNECRRLLATTVRQELQIESLLADWQQLATRRSNN